MITNIRQFLWHKIKLISVGFMPKVVITRCGLLIQFNLSGTMNIAHQINTSVYKEDMLAIYC